MPTNQTPEQNNHCESVSVTLCDKCNGVTSANGVQMMHACIPQREDKPTNQTPWWYAMLFKHPEQVNGRINPEVIEAMMPEIVAEATRRGAEAERKRVVDMIRKIEMDLSQTHKYDTFTQDQKLGMAIALSTLKSDINHPDQGEKV